MHSARIFFGISAVFAPFLLAPIALGVSACGSSSSTNAAPTPSTTTTATTPPSSTASASPQTRKLITGTLLPTSPGNLLIDPGFGQLTSQEASFGSFLAYYNDTNATFTPTTTLDSRSPTGFAGNVAIVLAAAATDTTSRTITMLASFLGGTGPFHAAMYVSKSTAEGVAATFDPTDTSQMTIAVATDFDDGPASSNASVYPLVADAATTTTNNGRTWVHYQVDVTDPLPDGAFFLIGFGAKGGSWELAAPEVTSAALEQQISTESSTHASAHVRITTKKRAPTNEERQAIQKYKSQKLHYRAPKLPLKIRGE